MNNFARALTIVLSLSLSLAACTSAERKEFFFETVGEIALDKKIELGYSSARCVSVKNSCSLDGTYTEWKQDDGMPACRCAKRE